MPMRRMKAPVKGTYQHYKGAFYEVLGIAEDPETGKRWVVYESIGITENLLEGKVKRSEERREGKERRSGRRPPPSRKRPPPGMISVGLAPRPPGENNFVPPLYNGRASRKPDRSRRRCQ